MPSSDAVRTLHLKPGRTKPLLMGHPWVFADSVADIEGDEEADVVRVMDPDGRVVGRGLYSPQSAIRVRLVERGDSGVDFEALLRERIDSAVRLRARLFPDADNTNVYRLVHSEGDGLPGLVVDRLGDVLVAQFATRPMHARREALTRILLERTGATRLVSRPAGFEREEGIPPDESPFVVGPRPKGPLQVRERGLSIEVSPLEGQKTGHFADQRENRVIVGALARELSVLDLYCGTGGFALQALQNGAATVLGVDSSARAIETATRNATHNEFTDGAVFERGDVTDVLQRLREDKLNFDLVVLDPPNLMPSKGSEARAWKTYRELNVRALARVEPGGFLATFSCSPRMNADKLLELVQSAGRDCRRFVRVLHQLHAGPDHPIAPGAPASRYLSGFVCQVQPW